MKWLIWVIISRSSNVNSPIWFLVVYLCDPTVLLFLQKFLTLLIWCWQQYQDSLQLNLTQNSNRSVLSLVGNTGKARSFMYLLQSCFSISWWYQKGSILFYFLNCLAARMNSHTPCMFIESWQYAWLCLWNQVILQWKNSKSQSIKKKLKVAVRKIFK